MKKHQLGLELFDINFFCSLVYQSFFNYMIFNMTFAQERTRTKIF